VECSGGRASRELIREEGDGDQDGTIDWGVDYTWDDRGNLVFVEQVGESSAHGGTSSYTYDEDDLVETIEWDYDGDGRQLARTNVFLDLRRFHTR
jgi:hypothetical protein